MNASADRRTEIRQFLDEEVFLQLEAENRAAIWNLSEGGVGFLADSPAPENGAIPFSMWREGGERLSGVGQIAWTDETRKAGGLRFTAMDERLRETIRGWLTQPNRTAEPSTESAAAAAKPAVPADAPTFPGTELVSLTRHQRLVRRQFVRGVLAGICVSVLVAVPVFKFTGRRPDPGVHRSGPEKAPATNGETLIAPPVPASPVKSTAIHPTPGFSSDTKSKKVVAPVSHSGASLTSVSAPGPATPPPALASLPQQSAELPPPADKKTVSKNHATPEQLWAAVQAGNTKAGVALADLYLRGEGVEKNCDQARVLLLIESKKGNAEATRKLQELDKGACP
jgi:hypothetical protein